MEAVVNKMNGYEEGTENGENAEAETMSNTLLTKRPKKVTINRPMPTDNNISCSKDMPELANFNLSNMINGLQPIDNLISDNGQKINGKSNDENCKSGCVVFTETDSHVCENETDVDIHIDNDSNLKELDSQNTKEESATSSSIDNNNSEKIEELDRTINQLRINEEIEHRLEINYVDYKTEEQMPDMMQLITQDLSEPYSIYTYRYFLHNWPHLSHLAYYGSECVGAIVCKLDMHRKNVWRGYIAMLVVHKDYRRYKIGSTLVKKAIKKMIDCRCDEVVLETEVTNKGALGLYENLGFVRDKRLLRYYLNGVDAWRLKLWLK